MLLIKRVFSFNSNLTGVTFVSNEIVYIITQSEAKRHFWRFVKTLLLFRDAFYLRRNALTAVPRLMQTATWKSVQRVKWLIGGMALSDTKAVHKSRNTMRLKSRYISLREQMEFRSFLHFASSVFITVASYELYLSENEGNSVLHNELSSSPEAIAEDQFAPSRNFVVSSRDGNAF